MRDVRAMSRAGRINQIVIAFQQAIKRGAGDEMTAYDIAFQIGMRAESPAFRDHLKAALDAGVLTCRQVQTGRTGVNGGVRFIYKLVAEAEPKKRDIPVKSKGVIVGQMRLF